MNANIDKNKEDLNKWIYIPCSWIRRINIKRSVLHNSIYTIKAILNKILVGFLQ